MSYKPLYSYGDSVLYPCDVKSIINDEYITDNVISYFFDYLSNKSKKVNCLSPSVVQLIKMTTTSQLDAIIDSTEMSDFEMIVLPINNSFNTAKVSGEHWSLLCYVKCDKTCYHIDSLNGSNSASAKLISRHLNSILKTDNRCLNLCCAQQNNGYDCGPHVIFNATQIVYYYLKNQQFNADLVQMPLPRNYRNGLILEIENIKE